MHKGEEGQSRDTYAHAHATHTLKYRQYIIQIFALFDVNKQVIYLQVDFASLSIENPVDTHLPDKFLLTAYGTW